MTYDLHDIIKTDVCTHLTMVQMKKTTVFILRKKFMQLNSPKIILHVFIEKLALFHIIKDPAMAETINNWL